MHTCVAENRLRSKPGASIRTHTDGGAILLHMNDLNTCRVESRVIGSVPTIGHFIGGRRVDSPTTARCADVFDPSTGSVQTRVALADRALLERAVNAAQAAQPTWAAMNPQRRARILFEFKRLVEADLTTLAHLIASEHGKVVADARGDIQRGLDVIEFACGIPHLLKGEYTSGAGPGIDVYSMRQPLGVVAGITPFNFPAMIPMWMFGPALASGNAFILKPSERCPSVPMRLAELLHEAGLPEGTFSVLNGDAEIVEAITDHDMIKAVSFVGSSEVAHRVYMRAAAAGKRVQAMGGAKNHGIILPDADLDQTIPDVVGAAFGSAGERCMALPVVVPVGDDTARLVRDRLITAIQALRVGPARDETVHYGPLVTAAHRARVRAHVGLAIEEGAELVLDGRNIDVPGCKEGFFMGPTLFDRVTPSMRSYQEEIFGPVLQIVHAADLAEAIQIASQHQYGNGVSIFTRDGGSARSFAERVEVGMVGINVPIPVPVSYHSFGGWKRSTFADLNQYGTDSVRFFTRTKVVTQRWAGDGSQHRSRFSIPTH